MVTRVAPRISRPFTAPLEVEVLEEAERER